MRLRAVSGTMLTLFVLSMLTLAFNTQPVKSDWTWTETIYIRADGSVDPDTAPISTVDNITYTLTDNIVGDVPSGSSAIVVERDNIVVDGAGYTVQWGRGTGIDLSYRSNVTIKNTNIKAFWRGVRLVSSNCSILHNNIKNNEIGISLESSSYNTVYGNNITAYKYCGISLKSSSYNTIYGNNIKYDYNGILLYSSSNYNNISGNNIAAGMDYGVYLRDASSYNTISGNNMSKLLRYTYESYGIGFEYSSNNTIYHNNFIDITHYVTMKYSASTNIWDDGYPSGGNYWSDHIGDDLYSGPYQNETGVDWIIDTPYVIDPPEGDIDCYPLIVPWPPKYKTYSLTVDPVFRDNTGTSLIQPSSWTIEFPGGTTRTVSSPVTYNLTQTGIHSIVGIIWKGTEVIPETTPTTSLTSDMVWSPSINCILPTSLSTSLSSSTSYVGFKVEINGNLTCNEVGLSGTPILLSYSVTGGETWNDITVVNAASDGSYSAVWMPSATGNYLVRATWSGNSTYPGITTTVNLAVTPFKEQNVFSVTSNSTVSEFIFNSTSRELSFTVTGPSDTTGYVNVYIAKTFIDNIADVKVYLDGDQLNYTATSLDDSWHLHFTYRHSTHTIAISLGPAPFIPPQLITPLSLGILAAALAVATAILIFKIRKGTPPTILNGVFRKSKPMEKHNSIHLVSNKSLVPF